MSAHLHTYIHLCQNRETFWVQVDFSGPKIEMRGSPVPPGCEGDYNVWKLTSFLPDVMNRMTPEQCSHAAAHGYIKHHGKI